MNEYEEEADKEAPLNLDSPEARLRQAQREVAKSDLLGALTLKKETPGLKIQIGKTYIDVLGEKVEIIGSYKNINEFFIGIVGGKHPAIYDSSGRNTPLPLIISHGKLKEEA